MPGSTGRLWQPAAVTRPVRRSGLGIERPSLTHGAPAPVPGATPRTSTPVATDPIPHRARPAVAAAPARSSAAPGHDPRREAVRVNRLAQGAATAAQPAAGTAGVDATSGTGPTHIVRSAQRLRALVTGGGRTEVTGAAVGLRGLGPTAALRRIAIPSAAVAATRSVPGSSSAAGAGAPAIPAVALAGGAAIMRQAPLAPAPSSPVPASSDGWATPPPTPGSARSTGAVPQLPLSAGAPPVPAVAVMPPRFGARGALQRIANQPTSASSSTTPNAPTASNAPAPVPIRRMPFAAAQFQPGSTDSGSVPTAPPAGGTAARGRPLRVLSPRTVINRVAAPAPTRSTSTPPAASAHQPAAPTAAHVPGVTSPIVRRWVAPDSSPLGAAMPRVDDLSGSSGSPDSFGVENKILARLDEQVQAVVKHHLETELPERVKRIVDERLTAEIERRAWRREAGAY